MRFGREQWSELWYTLKRNKKRSILTSLGVFAGMFFFTCLNSISEGLKNTAFEGMEGVSSELVYFIPGRTTKPYKGYKANRPINITYRDYLNLQRAKSVGEIAAFTSYGSSQFWSEILIKVGNKSGKETVWGVTSNYFEEVETMVPLYGRIITREEIEQSLPVCMVGKVAAKKYCDDISKMVGTYVAMNGVAFKVIGVVEPLSDTFSIADMGRESVMIPIHFAVGSNLDKGVFVLAKAGKGYSMDDLKAEAFQIISQRQNIDPTDTGAISTIDMQLFNRIFNMVGNGINFLVWIVGIGTLITGVISVSNILLVTVRERQREIGVRRALGAKPRDIRIQYMAESILIILLAGSIGMVCGLVFSLILGVVAENTSLGESILRPYPTVGILLLSVLIMLISGVLAGLLPVQKALQVKAIDAIRDE